jgi:hypothetical protein
MRWSAIGIPLVLKTFQGQIRAWSAYRPNFFLVFLRLNASLLVVESPSEKFKLALMLYSIFVHYQRNKLTMLFSQGKITSFLRPRQLCQKDVPEIKLMAQRIMSGIRN